MPALLALGAAAASQQKSVPPESTVQAAIVRLQAHDAAGAVGILEAVIRREPGNGRAWRSLGLAERELKNWDRATEAFQRALKVDPKVPTPMFQLAILYALKGDNEQAFAWLSKARQSRQLDMTQMEVTPELGPLKTDPRYSRLLPTRVDFRPPLR